jgi:hypothetical protein
MSEEESKATSYDWVTPKDGVHEAYSDWFHVNWLPLAVRIRFAQVVADPRISPGKGNWVMEERAAVTLPWATVKALSDMLAKLVKSYEEENGEISFPKMANPKL